MGLRDRAVGRQQPLERLLEGLLGVEAGGRIQALLGQNPSGLPIVLRGVEPAGAVFQLVG
jgi:hypothetical protein